MNRTLLDLNMRLLGHKRHLGGPKTDQILIFGQKRCARILFVAIEGQIGVNLSALITQQWVGPFWIPIYAFCDPKGPLEGQKTVMWAEKWAKRSLLCLKWTKLIFFYKYLLPYKDLDPFGPHFNTAGDHKAL